MHVVVYEVVDLSSFSVQSFIFQWSRTRKNLTKILHQNNKVKWRPGRDSDPGPAGDSRIYWTELYYLGIKRRKNTNNFS